jgi:hypothetical protein
MKKFKNIESYAEATRYIKSIFEAPVSQTALEESQEEEVIAILLWLFDSAKNSAVRAAIHHHALGDGLYLDVQEERETRENVYFNGMFCDFFSQTRQYAQLKRSDGSNKTLRHLTGVATYVVDDKHKEYFTQTNYLEKYDLE